MDKFAKLETLRSLLKEAGILEGKDYPKEIKIENVDIDKKTIHLSYS